MNLSAFGRMQIDSRVTHEDFVLFTLPFIKYNLCYISSLYVTASCLEEQSIQELIQLFRLDKFHMLNELRIRAASFMNDVLLSEWLEMLPRRCPAMTEISVDNYFAGTQRTLEAASRCIADIPSLKKLSLTGVVDLSDDQCKLFASSLVDHPSMHLLDLGNTTNMTYEGADLLLKGMARSYAMEMIATCFALDCGWYISQEQRIRGNIMQMYPVFTALASVLAVPRLGRTSPIYVLPIELIRRLFEMMVGIP